MCGWDSSYFHGSPIFSVVGPYWRAVRKCSTGNHPSASGRMVPYRHHPDLATKRPIRVPSHCFPPYPVVQHAPVTLGNRHPDEKSPTLMLTLFVVSVSTTFV